MIETHRFQLGNGLKVVVNPDPSTAMVAVNTLYNVGSRDEDPELTGLAHLFEHLMFGGSVNVADFDACLERAGGVSNAWTSNDFTNFYDVVPAHNFETALYLESDRMLSLAFSPRSLEIQRSVVIEEFKQQCLNRPYGDLGHHLRSLVYEVHPYRYPVIGRRIDDLRRVTPDDVSRFFFAHYAPNNAVIAISGNVDPDNAEKLVEKWYADIPARPIATRDYPAEPPQTAPRRAEVEGNVPATSLTIAFPMDGYGTDQYVAADLLTDIMANGTSSRFYRQLLIGSDIFAEVDASIIGSEEPGFLMVNAKLLHEGDSAVDSAVKLIDRQIDRLTDELVTGRELTRAVNRMESAATFANMAYLTKAQTLAAHEIHGEDINRAIDRYRALTPAKLRDAARQILDPARRSTLIYRPAGQS